MESIIKKADVIHAEPELVSCSLSDPVLLDLARTLEYSIALREEAPDFAGRIDRMTDVFGIKRLSDIVLASTALLLLSPVLGLTAAVIRLSSPGPAIFKQRRYGLNGRTFNILKFRTMYAEKADPSGVEQTRAADPRVTRIGRFLRRSNIDELPQLINVVFGHMSLVGPRPHVPNMRAGGVRYEELVPHYFVRQYVRPGLTGLAQSNGFRGSTENARDALARIDHDLAYIEHWSFGLDIKMLINTIRMEMLGSRGY